MLMLHLCAGPFTAAELAAHKQWMNDAQDKKDEIRETLPQRDVKALTAAARALEALTAREEAFWARTTVKAAQDLAAKNRGEARELLAAIRGSRWAEAQKALASLDQTCSGCHGLKLEKSPALSPRGR
jgi:hypothetical protein